MGLFKNYVNQTRKPEGFLGKMMLGGMNAGHALRICLPSIRTVRWIWAAAADGTQANC